MSRILNCALIIATATAATGPLAGCDGAAGARPAATSGLPASAPPVSTPLAAAPSPSPVASPPAAPSPSPVASPPGTADHLLITPDGVGPYRVGERPAPGLLSDPRQVDPEQCPTVYSYRATGQYAGTLLLVLKDGVLTTVETAGGLPLRTPEGARIGDSLGKVAKIYGSRGTRVVGEGGVRGLQVTSEPNAMILSEGPAHRRGVVTIAVGDADAVVSDYTDASGCVR